MSDTTFEENIQHQRSKVIQTPPEVKLLAPCKLTYGIISLSKEEENAFQTIFKESNTTKAFFIPASGSGSRMFEFLFAFLNQPNEENRGAVERFLNHIEDFAFFEQFSSEMKKSLRERTIDLQDFVNFILNGKGMGLANLPKGLIPFHKSGPFVLTPFHEHILQANTVFGENGTIHFTIQDKFKAKFQQQIEFLEGMIGKKVNVSFSYQDKSSNAIAFYENGELAYDEQQQIIERPAGHGALLKNLQKCEADILFVKNIDNVQHFSKSNVSSSAFSTIGGLLIQVRKEIQSVLASQNKQSFIQLNQKYQLFHPSFEEKDWSEISKQLVAPLRVCGMVKNEGLAGGGPFWVEDEVNISKQIIEKSQIEFSGNQYSIMLKSTHFNPVFMACEGKNTKGEVIEFNDFVDEKAYFLVRKNHEGKPIVYAENPGLWNGSMAGWNTVFVEVSSEVFSPVKTVLDLLESPHQA